MPNCFVKNCKSRTNYVFSKNVKYFSFPKDQELRLKWLEACRRDGSFKVMHERVCELHFSSNCMEYRTTKSRSTHISSKIVCTLRKGSVPTKLLDLPNEKQKLLHSFQTICDDNAGPSRKYVCTGIPTYTELVDCFKHNPEGHIISQGIDESGNISQLCTANANVQEKISLDSINFDEENESNINVIQEDAEVLMTNIELTQKSSPQLKKIKTPEEIKLLIDLTKKKKRKGQKQTAYLQKSSTTSRIKRKMRYH